MSGKIDIIAKFVNLNYGVDFSDRYLRPANIYNYVFECDDKQRYVWQSKQSNTSELTEGCIYHIRASVGRRLLGGRGLSVSDVEFIEEMNMFQ